MTKSHSNEDIEGYIKEYGDLIYKIVHKFRPKDSYQLDEFFNVGLFAMVRALENFDESLGYKKSTYIYRPIYWEIHTYICRKINKKKHEPKKIATLVAEPSSPPKTDPKFWLELEDHLNKNEFEIIAGKFLYNYTLEDLAKQQNTSKSSISIKYRQILKKLKKIIND